MPTYITPQNFSKVIVEIMKDGKAGSNVIQQVNDFIMEQEKHITEDAGKDIKNARIDKDTLKLIKSFLEEAEYDLIKFRTLLETWFDDMMNRISGWYKRKSQLWLLIIRCCQSTGRYGIELCKNAS